MKEKAVKKFLRLYGGSFPLRKRFNFTGFCNDVKSLIDEDYDHLLMKNQEVLTKNKKKELFRKKFYMELKEIEVDKNIMLEKKKKSLIKKQKLMLSSYNNKMMLDMMLNNKRYIKYMIQNNIKTRNNNKTNYSKRDESINNNMSDNNKTKDIFSSLNTFETIDEFIPQRAKYLNQNKIMNKTFSNFIPITLKKKYDNNNSFFKTGIPIGNQDFSPTLRNTLTNIQQNNKNKKYNININLPNLNNNYVSLNNNINIFNSLKKNKKKSNLKIKDFNNYNTSLRKKITFNNILSKKNSLETINDRNKSDSKSNYTSKKENLYSNDINKIRIIKSNIYNEQFNPIKTIYKTKINI